MFETARFVETAEPEPRELAESELPTAPRLPLTDGDEAAPRELPAKFELRRQFPRRGLIAVRQWKPRRGGQFALGEFARLRFGCLHEPRRLKHKARTSATPPHSARAAQVPFPDRASATRLLEFAFWLCRQHQFDSPRRAAKCSRRSSSFAAAIPFSGSSNFHSAGTRRSWWLGRETACRRGGWGGYGYRGGWGGYGGAADGVVAGAAASVGRGGGWGLGWGAWWGPGWVSVGVGVAATSATTRTGITPTGDGPATVTATPGYGVTYSDPDYSSSNLSPGTTAPAGTAITRATTTRARIRMQIPIQIPRTIPWKRSSRRARPTIQSGHRQRGGFHADRPDLSERRTTYAASDYWLADGQLHYIVSYGGESTLNMDDVDLQRTVDENARRGVNFSLKPRPNRANPQPSSNSESSAAPNSQTAQPNRYNNAAPATAPAPPPNLARSRKLKPVHKPSNTLTLGAGYRPAPSLSVRSSP